MRFYTRQHQYYCGIDLHTKMPIQTHWDYAIGRGERLLVYKVRLSANPQIG